MIAGSPGRVGWDGQMGRGAVGRAVSGAVGGAASGAVSSAGGAMGSVGVCDAVGGSRGEYGGGEYGGGGVGASRTFPRNSGCPIAKSSMTGFAWKGARVNEDRESSSTLYPPSFKWTLSS